MAVVSCQPCGAGTYNTIDTFSQSECYGCGTGEAGLSEREDARHVISRILLLLLLHLFLLFIHLLLVVIIVYL